MSKIIGTANSSFKGNDGTQITGTTVYTTEPIDPKRGQGESADHFFLSAAKLAALDFTPAVGQDVTVAVPSGFAWGCSSRPGYLRWARGRRAGGLVGEFRTPTRTAVSLSVRINPGLARHRSA